MSRTSQPSPLRQPPLEIRLPPLHDQQLAVVRDRSRFKVVCCGRQWGKTVLGATVCVAEAARGGHVQWVAPSFPIGELGWNIIDNLCRQIPGTRFEGRPVFRITLPTGGTIQLRSADNPDSLRGATLTGVVFDEAAIAKPEAWPTLRPTLSVLNGWAMFISTPKGLNWFNRLYEDAGARDTWGRWRFPSTGNPHLQASDVEQARGEMSSLVFAQEYLAEFISYGSGMFHADWVQRYRTLWVPSEEGEQERFFLLGEERYAEAECWKFHTVDLAWSMSERADYTVISTWLVTPTKHLVLLDVIRDHLEGPEIVPAMQRAWQTHGGSYMAVERTTKQMGIITDAERAGLPIKELKADKDKVARALPATARMERHTVWFPQRSAAEWLPAIEEELLAFPAGEHDDFVDTLAYACLELSAHRRSVYEDRGVMTV